MLRIGLSAIVRVHRSWGQGSQVSRSIRTLLSVQYRQTKATRFKKVKFFQQPPLIRRARSR